MFFLILKEKFVHSVNTLEISQNSAYESIESVSCQVKYHFIPLMMSNSILFNKTLLFFIFLGNNHNLSMVSLVRKKSTSDHIRSDKNRQDLHYGQMYVSSFKNLIWADKIRQELCAQFIYVS